MTREELAVMTGETVEDVDYTLNIVLKQIKPDFVKMAIKAELAETEEKIKQMVADKVLCYCNGILHVNWGHEEQDRCYEANRLIYRRNRLNHLLYHN